MTETLKQLQAIIDGAKLILNTGAISMSNHGNFSVKVPDKDQILITAQSSLAGVTPESLAILRDAFG